MNPLKLLLPGLRECPGCGQTNVPGFTHCAACGERLVNRNPLVRLFVTVLALAVVAAVLWWNWRR